MHEKSSIFEMNHLKYKDVVCCHDVKGWKWKGSKCYWM